MHCPPIWQNTCGNLLYFTTVISPHVQLLLSASSLISVLQVVIQPVGLVSGSQKCKIVTIVVCKYNNNNSHQADTCDVCRWEKKWKGLIWWRKDKKTDNRYFHTAGTTPQFIELPFFLVCSHHRAGFSYRKSFNGGRFSSYFRVGSNLQWKSISDISTYCFYIDSKRNATTNHF